MLSIGNVRIGEQPWKQPSTKEIQRDMEAAQQDQASLREDINMIMQIYDTPNVDFQDETTSALLNTYKTDYIATKERISSRTKDYSEYSITNDPESSGSDITASVMATVQILANSTEATTLNFFA